MARLSVVPPGGEPFFDELQRLQPDVDVVLLPPAPAPPRDLVAASPEATHEAAVGVRRALTELLGDAHVVPGVRVERWQREAGDLQRFTARASRRGLDAVDALATLRVVRDAVLARGWDARPTDTAQPRMTATHPSGRTLEAFCTPTSVDLVVHSPALVPDPDVRASARATSPAPADGTGAADGTGTADPREAP